MLKRLCVTVGMLCVIVVTACSSHPGDVKPGEKPNESREWVVKWRGEPDQAFLDTVEVLRENKEEHTMLVRVNRDIDQEKWRAEWMLADDVEYIQPNFQYKLNAIDHGPEPPVEVPPDYHLDQIGVKRAWNEWQPKRTVTIAVIDTGIDMDNPLIAPHLVKPINIVAPGEEAQDITDEDVRFPEEQGKTDDEIKALYEDDHEAYQYFLDRSSAVGHGTSVTGVLLQVLGLVDGDQEVAATDKTAKIMPIKVMGFHEGELVGGSDFDMAEAIRLAVDRGADIITLSLGDWASSRNARDAVAHAEESGVLVVAAAGNGQNGVNEPVFYPAAFPSVVAVGGVTPEGLYDEDSNHGMGLDIVAPDEHIRTLNVGGEFRYMDGNSFAAPQVTAVAAMIMQQNPFMSPEQVRQLLRQTSNLPEGNWNKETGYGRLNALRAVTEAPQADIYMGNHTQSRAASVSLNDRIQSVLSHSDGEKWFVFDTPELGDGLSYQLNVRVQFSRTLEKGIELLVKRPGEHKVLTYSLTRAEEIALTVKPGEVYLAVRFQEDEPSRYLAFELETDLSPAPDPYEDNDEQWHAYDLNVEDDLFLEGTFHKDGDMDWYRIKTPESGNLSITVSASTPRIDPVLFVQQLGGSGILVDEAGPMQQEHLQIRVEAEGVYYIRVHDFNMSATVGTYQLWVNYDPVVSDANEPNNRSDQATRLPGPNQPVSATLQHSADYDWYRFSVWGETDVTLAVTEMEGDVLVELNLYDEDLQAIGSQKIAADKTAFNWRHQLAEGEYYIRLRRLSGEETTPYAIAYLMPGYEETGEALLE